PSNLLIYFILIFQFLICPCNLLGLSNIYFIFFDMLGVVTFASTHSAVVLLHRTAP
ncbi:hypothetical protein J4Q44_G00377600, partial [Coregonus suidteri]